MTEHDLVYRFQRAEVQLHELGYKVSAVQNGFYIHNSKGTIVADVTTVDGLRAFAQGVEWMKSEQK